MIDVFPDPSFLAFFDLIVVYLVTISLLLCVFSVSSKPSM